MADIEPGCPLCTAPGGILLIDEPLFRVIEVDDAMAEDYPGMLRLIWRAHVREMSDLSAAEAAVLLDALLACERVLRSTMQCDKVNLASFGNQVPHLHWHLIPRYADDAHFPQPVWATRQRDSRPEALHQRRGLAAKLRESLQLALT